MNQQILFVMALLLVAVAVNAVPLPDAANDNEMVSPENYLILDRLLFKKNERPPNADLRDLIEKWLKGDIGLRKSLKALAQMVRLILLLLLVLFCSGLTKVICHLLVRL